jgi:hypothetical protein
MQYLPVPSSGTNQAIDPTPAPQYNGGYSLVRPAREANKLKLLVKKITEASECTGLFNDALQTAYVGYLASSGSNISK